MSLKLNSSGGGSISLQEPSTASNRTLTLPDNTGNLISSADSGTVSQTMLASGVAGNGPAFSAYQSSNQNFTGAVLTKIAFQTEEFDTANCFDSAANYRFTPNVAGYYLISGRLQGTTGAQVYVTVYKNGSLFKDFANNSGSAIAAQGSALVYLNGSTDYVELYGYLGSTQNTQPGQQVTYFQAALLRAA